MPPLFKKLNYKSQTQILVVNAPSSFEQELSAMKETTQIVREINQIQEIEFAIVFATQQAQIDNTIAKIAPCLKGDAILWYCYPKASSKNYTCEFNRDTGWTVVGQYNLEPVRQVALDADWSAIRFRKVEYIKNITRRESFAITQQAKQRTTKKGE